MYNKLIFFKKKRTMLEDWAADLIQQYPREYYKG